MSARYLVGIDLGTTNSALAYIDLAAPEPRVIDLPPLQLVAAGEVQTRPTLPSAVYLTGAHDFPAGGTALPWRAETTPPGPVVGELARRRGAEAPARLVTSAKSWLSHPGVDRSAKILPWGSAAGQGGAASGEKKAEIAPISPVDASALILTHVREVWDHVIGQGDPARMLAAQEVVLTVPASFDAVARELTLEAARRAGLPMAQLSLLEEPQAAFYAWLAEPGREGELWQAELGDGGLVLVCDVGGGTTDFTLIDVRPGAAGAPPTLERVAVGDHLLLGGDNMDLALARRLEGRLAGGAGARLEAQRFQELVQKCRAAKEALLGDEGPTSVPVHVAGRGTRLIGGGAQTELARDEVLELVLGGFFPEALSHAAPTRAARAGLVEWGLPYASDPAITRHLAAFLRRHAGGGSIVRPAYVLFNGGVMRVAALRERVLAALRGWAGEEAPALGALARELPNSSPDLAVARGAAYYGLARRGRGVRVRAGAARGYYVELDPPGGKVAGQVTALCVAPRGMDAGHAVEVPGREFKLLISRPAQFRLLSASARADALGAVVTLPHGEDTAGAAVAGAGELGDLPPIYTALRWARPSPESEARVRLEARVTELGTLELALRSQTTEDRWRLQFDLRVDGRAAEAASGGADKIAAAAQAVAQAATAAGAVAGPASGETAASELGREVVARGAEVLRRVFGSSDAGALPPSGVMKELERAMEAERTTWSSSTLRALWDTLREARGGRGRSPEHEQRWLNLAGFFLRPGFGVALDDWRMKEIFRVFQAPLVHEKDDHCRLEWWILWRRVSGGLRSTQQDEVFKRIAPYFVPEGGKRAQWRKAPAQQEEIEMWRTAASLERLSSQQKVQLGQVLVARLDSRRGAEFAFWVLGRLGARVPLYGPVNCTVPRAIAEGWLEKILAMEWRDPRQSAFAATLLGRRTGDRARDVDDGLRARLMERLSKLPDGERLIELVREAGALSAKEERFVFGDALPAGLALITDDERPAEPEPVA